MDANTELLNYIYQNAQMGQDTLTQLMKISEDANFAALLQKQKDEYKDVYNSCEELVKKLKTTPKGIGKVAEISTYLTVGLETLANKTASHIAEMVMQGSVMGIVDITRNLRKYQDADPESVALGKKLLQIEESCIERYKAYL